MSTEAVAWAMRSDLTGKLSAEHRLVLLSLADHASFDGNNAWPSKATIADRLDISTRSVQRAFARLEALGLIVKGDQRLAQYRRADRRPTVWNLRVGARARPEILDEDPTILDETGQGYPQGRGDTGVTPHGETPVTPRGDTGGTHGETLVSPKPNTEPTTEEPPNPRAAHRPDRPASSARAGRPVDNPGRRPDGTCRRCDDFHPLGTECEPLGDAVAGAARARAALAAARAAAREDQTDA